MEECRICLDEDIRDKLISPCRCNGTSKWVHEECLQTWRLANMNNDRANKCEICNAEYITRRIQPFETYIIYFYTSSPWIEIAICIWFTMVGGILIYLIDSSTDYQSLKIFNIDDADFLVSKSAYTDLMVITQSVYKCQYVVYSEKTNPMLKRLETNFMQYSKTVAI